MSKTGKGVGQVSFKNKPPKICGGENSEMYQLLLLVSYQWNRGTVSFISVRHSVLHLLTQLVLPECLFLMFNTFSCYDRQSLDLDKIQQKYAKLEVLVCLTVFHALPSALLFNIVM